MKKNIITITGMHCASCASASSKRKYLDSSGVENISVNVATEQAHIAYDESTVSIDEHES
jgi:cation transport ATPase